MGIKATSVRGPRAATPRSRGAHLRGYGLAAGGIAAATGLLWLAGPLLSLGSVYLVYLVVVVGIAATHGARASVPAAVLAFLAANFFFTPPLFTFTIAAPQDILALVIFLGLATGTSHLMARLRYEAEEARRHEQAMATLYQLSRTINQQQNLGRLTAAVEAQLSHVFHLRGCRVLLAGPGAPADAAPGALPRPGETRILLVAGGTVLGALLLETPRERAAFTPDDARLLTAFGEQLATAIQRAQLQETATQAEVLRRTDALRVALLSAVAHDLRTPLATIKTVATSLQSTRLTWSEADRREMLATIVAQVDHIARLIGDLLAMGRIESGRLRPQKEPAAIADLIGRVLERLAPQLAAHPVTVAVPPGLPLVPMDAVEIDEVVSNLLENAAKYTPPGTPIRVSVQRIGAALRVEVADAGPGIPAEHLPYLFDRYYRVQTGPSGGSGLGLAIARGLVEAHGGQITVVSRPGPGADAGTTFTFTLPLATPGAPLLESTEVSR